jgi:hypothetical protein
MLRLPVDIQEIFVVRVYCLCLALMFGAALTEPAEAQLRLNFPTTLSAQDLGTTGFAFVNTSPASVSATFNAYGKDGTLLTQSTLSVPAKGQTARLASEVLPGVTATSWIQVVSPSAEVQGFELIGDFMNLVDGAGPAPEATQLAVLSFSSDDILYLANPGSQSANVQIKVNKADGTVFSTKSVTLSAFQPTSFRLADLSGDGSIDLISITSNVAISASLTTKLPEGADVGVTNAAPVANATSELFFPYAPSGAQGSSNWKTLVAVANVGSTTQNVSLTFTPDTGSPTTIQRSLPPGASTGGSAGDLFSLPASLTAGWIHVTGSGSLVGVAAYQDTPHGSLAMVPSQSTGSTRFLFGHIASLPPWYTGIALLNTSTTAANVEIYAIDSAGKLLGSGASFSVAPNTRRTALLSEFVPQLLQRSSDGGWVFLTTTNNVPLLGFELFGHFAYPILANVQGFAVPGSSTFMPPPSTVPTSSGVDISQVGFSDGLNPKAQFNALDTIVYTATITNSSGATGSAQLTFVVSDPRNQTLFTSTTSITLPATSGDMVYVSHIPSNALNGQYLLTAKLVYQNQLVLKSAGFDVSGGTSTPTADQDPAYTVTSTNGLQRAFRPGDTMRVVIPLANFTGQTVSATINYQLRAPGANSLSSGNLAFSMPAGISTQTIDVAAPSLANQGLVAFVSTLSVGAASSTKTGYVTIVPKSAAETITVDNVFVSDSKGVPQGTVAPGSNSLLNIWRLSLFPVGVSATVRYTITASDSSTPLDQTLLITVSSGGSLGFIPLPDLPVGNYTFKGTISYTGNSGLTSSSLTVPFSVSNSPTPLKETISTMHPHLEDINGIPRTSFSPGESLFFFRAVYSTFAAPTPGTLHYQIPEFGFDAPVNTTFNPGMNVNFIGITTTDTIPTGQFTLTTVANAGGQSSSSSTPFSITGPPVPHASTTVEQKRVVSEPNMFSTAPISSEVVFGNIVGTNDAAGR